MSEPFPSPIEIALERLTRATLQLSRTVVASDSRHADGQSAILSRIDDLREAVTALLEAAGQTHRAVREVTGTHQLLPEPAREPWYARLALAFLAAPARSQAAVVLLTAIVAFGGWVVAIVKLGGK